MRAVYNSSATKVCVERDLLMVRMVGWIVAVMDARGASRMEGSRAGGGYDGKRVLIRSVSACIA